MTLNGYAVADHASRLQKARKIEAMLDSDSAGRTLLDLGTGSGLLADYFRSRGAIVSAADRDDVIYMSDIPLTRIDGDILPFANAMFDFVVFNHVIEHVGAAPEQRAILAEIERILKPGGKLYLAVPSKWALIEPHFRLPLLGALPRGLANYLVRKFCRAPEYDCYPMTRQELHKMLEPTFAFVENKTLDALAWVVEHELNSVQRTIFHLMPAWLLSWAQRFIPTYIMVCTAQSRQEGGVIPPVPSHRSGHMAEPGNG